METIRKEVIPGLFVAVLIGVGGYILRRFGFVAEFTDLIPAVVLLILLLLLIRFYRSIRRKLVVWGTKAELQQDGSDQQIRQFKEMLADLIESPNGSKLSGASGLTGWYPGFKACRPRIHSLLTEATSVKLLTYIAQSDIGKGAIFYEAIAQNRNASIRVLLCSENSPYVSPEFAPRIGHDKEKASQWKRRILETQNDIRNLREYHRIDISMKTHNLPFSWRLWFIDDTLFVTAMLYHRGRENHQVPVYEIHRSSDQKQSRLFEMFERYFEIEWDAASELQ